MLTTLLRGCATAMTFSALAGLACGAPAQAASSQSKMTRLPGGVIISTPLTEGIWLHTKVARSPLFCSFNRTMFGRATRQTTHELEAFTTVGSDPNGRAAPVQHLRLISLIGEDRPRVKDCGDADWCWATYREGCHRTCARGEASNHGHHVTDRACLEKR